MVQLIKDEQELEQALTAAGSKLVVVDFYADWCGPCKQIAPKIATLSEEMKDVVFLKINVDDSDELAMTHGVKAMPTFIFFRNSKKVDEMVGANYDKLKEKIAAKNK